MKLFLLEQYYIGGYDTYDSLVVCAENEEDAKLISPYRELSDITDKHASWVGKDRLDQIKVTYLGEAKEGLKRGLVLASFNAG